MLYIITIDKLRESKNDVLDVNARTDENYTALIIATECGYPEMVKRLIELGASVKSKNDEGRCVE